MPGRVDDDAARGGRVAAARLPGGDRLLGAHPAHGGALLAGRPGVRRREERRHQGVRQPDGHDANRVRRPSHAGAQLLGPWTARSRPRSELPDGPVGLRPVHLRRRHRRYGPALGIGGRDLGWLPDTARRDGRRLCGRRPPLAAPGVRQRDDRVGAGADRGLVPAVPEPLDRQSGLRCRRRALRQRWGRRQLQLRRLGAGRRAGQPVRRSAGRRRRHVGAAHGRGWGTAQPGHPDDGRPHQSRRRDPAGRSGHRRRPPRQPDGVQRRRQRSAHRGQRAAQSVPHHDPSRHQRGLDR